MSEEEKSITAEELAEFRAFQKAKEEKRRAMALADERRRYARMVDDEIEKAIPLLRGVSQSISKAKQEVYDNFKAVIDLKRSLFPKDGDEEQRSYTFTNAEGTMRIKLGFYVNDNYRDTVEDGIVIIKDYLASLAKDERTSRLVEMVLRLLSKDSQGNMKASRVLQLRRMAEQSGDEKFLEGVRIIEDAYQPVKSKQFLSAFIRGDKGEWTAIPLGMSEA